MVKLGGKMMLPGFIDSHMHASMTVSSLYSVLLYGLTSVDQYVAAVAEFAGSHTDMDVIRGQGWSNTVVPNGGPLASSLDAVVSDKPVSIMSEDGHSYWVNSKALALAKITGKTPGSGERRHRAHRRDPGDRPAVRHAGGHTARDGRRSGERPAPRLHGAAVQGRRRLLPEERRRAAGLTTVFDPLMYTGSNGVQALEEMASKGALNVRWRAALALTPADDFATWLTDAKAERVKHKTAMFKTPAVKIFADGVVEGHTAYLNEPYADALAYKGDANYRGEPIWQPNAMKRTFVKLDKAGFQIHTHAIGDAATSETLDALAFARKANGAHDWRPGITHIQLVDRKDFRRFREAGRHRRPRSVLVPQGRLLHEPAAAVPGPAARGRRVPDEELLRRRGERGVGQRLPGDDPAGPARGHRRRREPLGAGLRLRLSGAAEPQGRAVAAGARDHQADDPQLHHRGRRANFLDKQTGTIKVGKRADLVVLNMNLFKVARPTDLFKAHVRFTMGSGKVLYDTL